ncbi:redoxin domain-containing protein [Microbacterium sp. SORGH_AS_0888]|uniref:redoxin domain-containing protein n=1 Tax=Microbacterium sp. SORGH_AS_0888 TaxID=3041791 RepID=UPI0027818FDB|nr:redoxin domain-containing protein [Microbacterium sp. SORGH_AS_0888]MDQ1128359.1 alkyl hydroperoxide reductase subunit AhpC [Microbacterium sp. SORGH_AS_0888]
MTTLLLGDRAPDFRAESQDGPLHLYGWQGGSWVVLFSHPRDFTPVCSTEVAEIARLSPEFTRRDVKVATLSTGTPAGHAVWAEQLTEAFGTPVRFPLISDPSLTVARLYGMLHPSSSDVTTIRSVFVIDPQHRVRLTLSYPPTTGRNFAEILRVVDSLQIADRQNVVTPANWMPGSPVLVPHDIGDDEAEQRWGEVDRTLPYVRKVSVAGRSALAPESARPVRLLSD